MFEHREKELGVALYVKIDANNFRLFKLENKSGLYWLSPMQISYGLQNTLELGDRVMLVYRTSPSTGFAFARELGEENEEV